MCIRDSVWIVAPDIERSGMSRALTLSDPIRVRKISEKRFSCSGTPTDCVLLGVLDLVKGAKPDLILSGVNRGQNLAEDVTVSGTVAGAVQGMQMGIPSMALSQSINYHLGEDVNWDVAKKHGADVVKRLIAHSWPQSVAVSYTHLDVYKRQIYNYGFIADKNFYHAIKNLIWLFHINCFAVLVFRNRNTKALLAVLSLLALPFLYIGYVCFALVHLIINCLLYTSRCV